VTGPGGQQRASRGAIGGAAGDGGVEYRRGVAAYVVANGLAGVPLRGFGPPPECARIGSVSLETDDVVDDIRIDFESGFVTFVQAKRRLDGGNSFKKAIAQWARAAKQGLDPDRDRLVIVTGSMSGPMSLLGRALVRLKTDIPGGLTGAEREAIDRLDAALDGLDADQLENVHKCALIHQLDVEENFLEQAREGGLLLASIVDAASALPTWHALLRIAGRAARRRGGFALEGWFRELQGEGIRFSPKEGSIAAILSRRNLEVDRYFDILRRRANKLDLRGLGCTIPPIPMSEIDAKVRVLLDEDDSRSDADVLWAFLRRGRMVLTGLPGGGKSTVLAGIASRLSLLSDGPIPLLASLADIDREDQSLSFRDRFLKCALKELPEASRIYARDAIEELLEVGGIALLFDSLDETYQRRSMVVMELDQFLSTVSPNVNVLLATRDVAYAHAETLGWPHLRLLSPQDLDKTIEAIIRSGAKAHFEELGSLDPLRESWVKSRQAWVADALHSDPLLRETPLLPVLLSLLSIERDEGALPAGRAAILKAVVDDVVRRREARRGDPFRIGRLHDGDAARAALQAFALEGSSLVLAGGRMSLADLSLKIADMCRLDWGLAVGQASETADALVRFWDESGIFVISGAEQSVAPRLLLFAEIGDALNAAGLSEHDVRTWVSTSIERRSIEPVVLAAGLSPFAADELVLVASRQNDRELLLAATRAISEGAQLSSERAGQVVVGLIADAAVGDYEGWQSWLAMAAMPKALIEPGEIRHSARTFSTEHQVLVNAMVDLRFRTTEELILDPERLLAVLTLHGLPPLPRRQAGDDRRPFRNLVVDQSLASTILHIADILLGTLPAAKALILQGRDKYSVKVHQELVRLLESRGFGDELEDERLQNKEIFATTLKMLENYNPDDYLRLLEHLADHDCAMPAAFERTNLDELADFLETMNFNHGGTKIAPTIPVCSLIEVVARLGRFDLAKIAPQASIVLRRIVETDAGHEPFFALFDLASERHLDDWDAITDKNDAVELLLKVLTWSYGSAVVAGIALYGAPVAELAVPGLRMLLPRVASSENHVILVAKVLCSLVDGPEPEVWVNDTDAFLRIAAAQLCDPVKDGNLSVNMKLLLNDSDGTVREAAVKRLAKVSASDRELALSTVAGSGKTGWTCLSCRTFNEAGSISCMKQDCMRAGAHPSSEAVKLLSVSQ